MGNVSHRFIIIIFDTFLWMFVLINYLGWSGGYINIVSFTEVNWTNSYFGLNSFWALLRGIDDSLNAWEFLSPKMFVQHLEDLLNTITFGLPKVLGLTISSGWDVINALDSVFNLLFQPIMMVIRSFVVIAHIVWYALCILFGLFNAFGGMYNIPMAEMPSKDEYMQTINVLMNVKRVFTPFLPLGV